MSEGLSHQEEATSEHLDISQIKLLTTFLTKMAIVTEVNDNGETLRESEMPAHETSWNVRLTNNFLTSSPQLLQWVYGQSMTVTSDTKEGALQVYRDHLAEEIQKTSPAERTELMRAMRDVMRTVVLGRETIENVKVDVSRFVNTMCLHSRGNGEDSMNVTARVMYVPAIPGFTDTLGNGTYTDGETGQVYRTVTVPPTNEQGAWSALRDILIDHGLSLESPEFRTKLSMIMRANDTILPSESEDDRVESLHKRPTEADIRAFVAEHCQVIRQNPSGSNVPITYELRIPHIEGLTDGIGGQNEKGMHVLRAWNLEMIKKDDPEAAIPKADEIIYGLIVLRMRSRTHAEPPAITSVQLKKRLETLAQQEKPQEVASLAQAA